MRAEEGPGRFSRATLTSKLEQVLEYDSDFFEKLLESYPDRIAEVIKANGANTNYWSGVFEQGKACILEKIAITF